MVGRYLDLFEYVYIVIFVVDVNDLYLMDGMYRKKL